jgi:hypothetical protein
VERTQISLESEQAERLRALARQRGVSMAHLIRDAVDQVYGGAATPPTLTERWDRALGTVGIGNAEAVDLAENHDRYLDDAYGS